MLHIFHMYVSSVLFRCYICLQCLSSVFSCVFVSVSDTCFKCFICLLFYVASITSVCFNSTDVTRGINVKIEREREWSPRGRAAQV
jgi:hypothetical protein